MGFGLPAAIGAAVAWDGTDKGRPKKVSEGLALSASLASVLSLTTGSLDSA